MLSYLYNVIFGPNPSDLYLKADKVIAITDGMKGDKEYRLDKDYATGTKYYALFNKTKEEVIQSTTTDPSYAYKKVYYDTIPKNISLKKFYYPTCAYEIDRGGIAVSINHSPFIYDSFDPKRDETGMILGGGVYTWEHTMEDEYTTTIRVIELIQEGGEHALGGGLVIKGLTETVYRSQDLNTL